MGVGPCIELNMFWTWTLNPAVGGFEILVIIRVGHFGVVSVLTFKNVILSVPKYSQSNIYHHIVFWITLDQLSCAAFVQICGIFDMDVMALNK